MSSLITLLILTTLTQLNQAMTPCASFGTCVCTDAECVFDNPGKEATIICSNKVNVCQVVCKKDQCAKIKIYSSALETNVMCVEDKAGSEIELTITDVIPSVVVSTTTLTQSDFNGIKTSANVYCMASETCLKAKMLFDAEFTIDPVIDAAAVKSFNDGSLICKRNVCKCENCPVESLIELRPTKATVPIITIPSNVVKFDLICETKDGCKGTQYNIDSPNVQVECSADACESILLNLNYVQQTLSDGMVSIGCSSCTKSQININGKYSSIIIRGDENEKALAFAQITTSNTQQLCQITCELDIDGNSIGCDDITFVGDGCNCVNCPGSDIISPPILPPTPTDTTTTAVPDPSAVIIGGDRICNNKLNVCIIECRNADCKKQRFRSSSKTTIITCYANACEEAVFIIGDQELADIQALGLSILDFQGTYEQFIFNCDESSSCKKTMIELNGIFKSVIITGSAPDSLTDSSIVCNTFGPTICEINCGAKSCTNMQCKNNCQCSNLTPDLPGCPLEPSSQGIQSQVVIEGEQFKTYECGIESSFCFLYCLDYKEQCKGVVLNTKAKYTQVICQTEKACSLLKIIAKPNELGKGVEDISVSCAGDNISSCEKIYIDVEGSFKSVKITGEGNKSIKEPEIRCNEKTAGTEKNKCVLDCGADGSMCETVKSEFLFGDVECIGVECV